MTTHLRTESIHPVGGSRLTYSRQALVDEWVTQTVQDEFRASLPLPERRVTIEPPILRSVGKLSDQPESV